MINFLIKFPILKRLIPSLGMRILRFFNKNRGYFQIEDINFFLDFLDPIDRQIIIYKNYEYDQVSFLENQIKKYSFDYFFDIGANSGYYSFYFANKFKHLKIKAFEPNQDALNKFKKTLNKNFFANIDIFNFGLSDQERNVKFFSLNTHNYTHSNSVILENLDIKDKENCKIFEAPVKSGDKLFYFKNKKLLFKIDVEEHEIYTLKGLIKNLSNNKCLILIEISDKKFNTVHNFLYKNNFKQIFKSKYRLDYVYSNFK